MAALDREELRDVVADLVNDNGVVEVLNALWHWLDIVAARIESDQEREPYRRVCHLLDEAAREFQDAQ